MYHGITRNDYNPQIRTQLPEKKFRQQIEFLKSQYNLVSLSTMISMLESGDAFPERTAMITFDDGLRNNHSVAYPILKEFSVPAAIFLATDFMGTNRYFWFDELYFLVQKALRDERDLSQITELRGCKARDASGIYNYYLERMKRIPEDDIKGIMNRLKDHVSVDMFSYAEDVGMLTWDHILEMKASGLVEFGVHTANHRILTGLAEDEWEKEISEPQRRLSRILGKEVTSFCYPNGKPHVDFADAHVAYLKQCGYQVSFATENRLHTMGNDPYQIGRIPAGNDLSSEPEYFPLATSGFIEYVKQIVNLKA